MENTTQLGKEYTTLFNGITDAIEELNQLAIRLSVLQCTAENFYIENDLKN